MGGRDHGSFRRHLLSYRFGGEHRKGGTVKLATKIKLAGGIAASLGVISEVRAIASVVAIGPQPVIDAYHGKAPDLMTILPTLIGIVASLVFFWAVRRTISVYRSKWEALAEQDGVVEYRYTVTERRP